MQDQCAENYVGLNFHWRQEESTIFETIFWGTVEAMIISQGVTTGMSGHGREDDKCTERMSSAPRGLDYKVRTAVADVSIPGFSLLK